MSKVKVEVILVVVAMVVGMSSVGAAAQCFPLDCVSYALEGRAVPLKLCCIEVQDQFLLKAGVGIAGYCNAVTAVQRYNGPLVGTELDLALAIPGKCNLNSYYQKGSTCAGGCHSIPFAIPSTIHRLSMQSCQS